MFYKTIVLKNFAVFIKKYLCWCLFLNKYADLQVCNFIKKETPTQAFSCEYSQILKNTYFEEEHLWMAASESFSFYVSLNVFLHEQIT